MSPTIEVTTEVLSRLEKHVIGFDTPSNVINRLLDGFEKQQSIIKPKLSYSPKATNTRLFSNKEIQHRISSVAETIPMAELELLCNEQHSKDTFGISFPLFIKENSSSNQARKKQIVKSSDGVNRWTWKFEFIRNGYSFAICTQWYPKNDNYVQKWLNSHA